MPWIVWTTDCFVAVAALLWYVRPPALAFYHLHSPGTACAVKPQNSFGYWQLNLALASPPKPAQCLWLQQHSSAGVHPAVTLKQLFEAPATKSCRMQTETTAPRLA